MTGEAQAKRVALVIGNAAYKHAGLLANPGNDARGMADKLEALGFSVTTGLDLARDPMENALFDFESDLKGANVALLFYAGHGLQVKGENYLLPVDADIEMELHLKRRAFSLSEVLGVMSERTPTNLVFLDACRNNPFTRTLSRNLNLEGPRTLRSGLAEVRAAKGTFIAFATSPNEVALDGRGKNSPFTEALLNHIDTPGLSVSDMMTDVIDAVARTTNEKQEPWQQSNLRAKFYFKPIEVLQEEAPPPPEPAINPLNPEHEHWAAIRDSTDPNDFERFLTRFPVDDFADPAEKRASQCIAACDNIETLERLLKDYPASPRTGASKARLAALYWRPLAKAKDTDALASFIIRFADCPEASLAIARAERLQKERPKPPWPLIGGGAAAIVISIMGYVFFIQPPSVQPVDPAQTQEMLDRLQAEAAKKTEEDKKRAAEVEDDNAFSQARSLGTKAAYEAYLKTYSRHTAEARNAVQALDVAEAEQADDTAYAEAKRKNTKAAYEAYLARYPSGRNGGLARAQLQDLDAAAFKEAERANTIEAFQNYRDNWPQGQYVARAKQQIAALKAAQNDARRDPALAVAPGSGQSFRDCPNCPEMVVAPSGNFMRGSTQAEIDSLVKTYGSDWYKNEGPQRKVTFAEPFAVGKFAVTFAEWDACVEDGGCGGYKPEDQGWKRGTRPVINVSWKDAQAYVKWLSGKTKKEYSLLTEAQREYVTRAGTTKPYWWGTSISKDQANYGGNETFPVDSFKPNAWGLYQVHGNVQEWVEDCYHDTYNGAPEDGSAVKTGACEYRVLRGGSWGSSPRGLRAAYRSRDIPDSRGFSDGFRVARTLPHTP